VADEEGERGQKETANADPLRLVLHTMEEQLDDRVDAVSDRGPSRDESTSDLIRLEETLSSAQDKAKQLVTLRLKLDEEATDAATEGAAPGADARPDRQKEESASAGNSEDPG
jgi:hypothetical protein